MHLLRKCLPTVCCCLYICAFAFSFDAYSQAPVPRFEISDCAIPIPKDEKVSCGYLVVFEDRAIKNGRTIRLPIITLKSDNPKPQPDPILRTLGGPGVSSLGLVRGRSSSPWLKDRDLIIFEQRGTKYAQPALDCPEVAEAKNNSVKTHLDAKTARQLEIRSAQRCFDRFIKQEINLSAYNSAESAADIEDLRRVLKLDKINLWGLSYSCRLMLNVMRDHPKGIRSVVLESTLPPEVNYDEVGVDGIVYALNQVFKNCKLDAECAKAYPDLESKFYEVVRRLNKEPVSVGVRNEASSETDEIRLDGNDFVTWIVDYLLTQASAIADVPLVVNRTFQGNYETFKRYASAKSSSGGGLGMRYSVWCGEEVPFEDMGKIKQQSFRYPQLKGYEVMALPYICSVWKVRAARSIENKPVKSDIPTMVLAAEYDAYTPPAWGRSTAKNLENSFFYEVPWAGHGPAFSTPCLRDMIADFFNDPNLGPKANCLSKIKEDFSFKTKN